MLATEVHRWLISDCNGSLESGEFEYSPDYGMNATGVELSVSVNESLTTGIFIIRDSEAG